MDTRHQSHVGAVFTTSQLNTEGQAGDWSKVVCTKWQSWHLNSGQTAKPWFFPSAGSRVCTWLCRLLAGWLWETQLAFLSLRGV